MKNYLLMILAVATMSVLVLLQSKPLVYNGLSLKGQTIDNMGMEFANMIEHKFLGKDHAMAFGKTPTQNIQKSQR